jgi:hypothetical protein
VFVPLNVAVVVACYWLLRLFEFEERVASLTSIAWLLGTTVLPYVQVPQQNNQILLFVLISYAAVLAYIHCQQPRFLLLSGVAVGVAFLIRMTSVIYGLTVLLFLVGCLAYQSRHAIAVLKGMSIWIAGLIPLMVLGRLLDYMRFGNFWTTGNHLVLKQFNTDPIFALLPKLPDNWPFTNPPHIGILGALFSPAKSLFIYDPLLLPCLVLGAIFWKRFSPYIQWYIVTGVLNLGLHLVFYSRYLWWHGDAAWAARFHITSVHLLLIPLLALFLQLLLSTQKRLITGLMGALVVFAILVQLASVVLMFGLESAQGELLPAETRYSQFRLGQRFTNIACQIEAYGTNKSFAQKCITGSLESLQPFQRSFLTARHQFALLPFNYARFGFNRKWTFIFWGIILLLALITTAQLLSQTA